MTFWWTVLFIFFYILFCGIINETRRYLLYFHPIPTLCAKVLKREKRYFSKYLPIFTACTITSQWRNNTIHKPNLNIVHWKTYLKFYAMGFISFNNNSFWQSEYSLSKTNSKIWQKYLAIRMRQDGLVVQGIDLCGNLDTAVYVVRSTDWSHNEIKVWSSGNICGYHLGRCHSYWINVTCLLLSKKI